MPSWMPSCPTEPQSRNQSTELAGEKVFRPVSGLAVPLPVPSAYALGYDLSSSGLEATKSSWSAEKLMDCNTERQSRNQSTEPAGEKVFRPVSGLAVLYPFPAL